MNEHTLDILLWIVGALIVIFIGYSLYSYHKDCKAFKKRQNDDIK